MKEEFLRKRASEFYERAKEDFEKERYNLSAFDIEQALQLYLKYLIYLKVGDFPKTHYFDRLIEDLSEIYEKREIQKYYGR